MKNKLLIALFILPVISYANEVSLDSLVSNENSFCNQGSNGIISGILSFLKLNSQSDIYFKGNKVTKIEIKNPQISVLFSSEKIKEESKLYVSDNKPYNFKNFYRIINTVTFVVDSSKENLQKKLENLNPSNGTYYKKYGKYDPNILKQSRTMQEFENNIKTIHVPEYNYSIISNYENNTPQTTVMYQCKMVTYTNEDIATINQKLMN